MPGKVDLTTGYFNNASDPELIVSPEVDEAVISFFEQQTKNKVSARVLAKSVIKTSIEHNVNPMDIIQQFSVLPKGQLNLYLVMFLNLNSKGTSTLAISNSSPTNKYLTRTILP